MALDRLSFRMETSIKVHSKMVNEMELDCVSLGSQDLFTEENGVMVSPQVMVHFLLFQMKLLKQDLMDSMLLMGKLKFYFRMGSFMKATARTVCETSQVYIIMQMVIYMTENG